jgi:hypothetical protein
MTIKSKHEQELEAELKGLLSGALSAKDVLSGPRKAVASKPGVPLPTAMDKTAEGLRELRDAHVSPVPAGVYRGIGEHIRSQPALGAPYGPATDNHDSRDPMARVLDLLERLETRTVRMETRITNTMRYLGFPPRAPLMDPPRGRVCWSDGDLVVTGSNVPVRDISWLMAQSNPKHDVRIVVNNVVWATLHHQPQAAFGVEEN